MRNVPAIVTLLLLACSSTPSGTEGVPGGDDASETAGTGVSPSSGGSVGSSNSGGTGGRGYGGSNTGGLGGSYLPPDGGPAAPEDAALPRADAGGTDAAVSTEAGTASQTGSGCAGKGYKFCEDFEGGEGASLPAGWIGRGTASVATDQFHSGSKALKASQGRATKSLESLGAAVAGTHWGRIFFKVQSPAPTAGGVLHTTFVQMGQSRVVDTVESRDGKVQFLYNLPDDSCCRGSSYNWRFDDRWHCAEWYVNAETKSYKFFYDSVENTQIGFTGNARSRLTAFTSISVGVTYYQKPSRPFVAWLDDLAISDTRVGCEP